MKLLLVADLHYSLPQWDWLNETANRFDLVVVAGDLLEISSMVPLEAQIVVIRKYLAQLDKQTPLIVSSGNHDIIYAGEDKPRSAEWMQEKHGLKYFTDGEGFIESDHYFSILPWWESEEQWAAVEAQLHVQKAKAKGKRWIWVYHSPPKGSHIAWDGRRDFGDNSLPVWIERFAPDMVLGGHIHNAPFYVDGSWIDQINDTWVFNSGKQTGRVPCFTVIDTDANRAIWLSADDAEQAQLLHPLQRLPLN